MPDPFLSTRDKSLRHETRKHIFALIAPSTHLLLSAPDLSFLKLHRHVPCLLQPLRCLSADLSPFAVRFQPRSTFPLARRPAQDTSARLRSWDPSRAPFGVALSPSHTGVRSRNASPSARSE